LGHWAGLLAGKRKEEEGLLAWKWLRAKRIEEWERERGRGEEGFSFKFSFKFIFQTFKLQSNKIHAFES
jgi:hypothetical protein